MPVVFLLFFLVLLVVPNQHTVKAISYCFLEGSQLLHK